MKWVFAVVVLLAACQTVPEPEADLASVSVFSGSGFSGTTRMTIYADDRVRSTTTDHNGKTTTKWLPASAGRFQRAERLAVELVQRWNKPINPEACLDYGSDGVEIIRAGRVQSAVATCPDPVMQAAQSALYASVSP